MRSVSSRRARAGHPPIAPPLAPPMRPAPASTERLLRRRRRQHADSPVVRVTVGDAAALRKPRGYTQSGDLRGWPNSCRRDFVAGRCRCCERGGGMGQRAFFGILFPTIVVLAAGCATKGWVRDLVGTRTNEVNERVSTVDTRVNTVE